MSDEILEALQRTEPSGGLVTSYVLIAEVALPDDPDSTVYRVAYDGSHTVRRGLVEQLRDEVMREFQDGAERNG